MKNFIHSNYNTTRIMLDVFLALLPATLFNAYIFKQKFIINFIVACIFGFLLDFFFSYKYKNLKQIKDLTYLITASIILNSLAGSNLTILQILLTMIFSLVVAKQLFGGTGYNIFNPAAVGIVFIIVSFPAEVIVNKIPILTNFTVDSISGATPLDLSNHNNLFDYPVGYQNYWIILQGLYILGGLYLIFKKVVEFYLLVVGILIALLLSFIFYIFNFSFLSTLENFFTGGFIMGLIYMATDPVTLPASSLAKIICLFLIIFFTLVIRAFTNYPDGFAFAILIVNFITPLLDDIFKLRAYGN